MFDEYIGLYGARLYALCLRLCRYGADAQDLYQETWLRAWRARARYDTSRPFDAWLSRICVNAWRDQLRRQKLAQMLHARDAQCPAVNAQEDYSDVREAVDRLAEPLRRLLRRHAHPRHLRARLLLRVHRNALAHAAGADSALHRQVCSVIHTHSSFSRKDAPDFHFVYTKKSGARCITNAAEQGTILF